MTICVCMCVYVCIQPSWGRLHKWNQFMTNVKVCIRVCFLFLFFWLFFYGNQFMTNVKVCIRVCVCARAGARRWVRVRAHTHAYALNPIFHPTLYPTPNTLHPTPCTLHPILYTLHPTPYLRPAPYALRPTPFQNHSRRCRLSFRHQI